MSLLFGDVFLFVRLWSLLFKRFVRVWAMLELSLPKMFAMFGVFPDKSDATGLSLSEFKTFVPKSPERRLLFIMFVGCDFGFACVFKSCG